MNSNGQSMKEGRVTRGLDENDTRASFSAPLPPPAYQATESRSDSLLGAIIAPESRRPFRTLKFAYKDKRGSAVNVYETNAAEPIYYVRCQAVLRPHLKFYHVGASGNDKNTFGDATMHLLRTTTNVTLHGQKVDMEANLGYTQYLYNFACPALGGDTLRWKRRTTRLEFWCVDKDNNEIARFFWSKFARERYGELEFYTDRVESTNGTQALELMEEISITGMALAHASLYMSVTAGGSGGLGAAGT